MHIVVGLMGVVGILWGLYAFFVVGQSAIHEIEGMIGFVVGVVGLGTAAIVEKLGEIKIQLRHNAQIQIAMHRAEHPELHEKGAAGRAIVHAIADAYVKCKKCGGTEQPHRRNRHDALVCMSCDARAQQAAATTPAVGA